MANTVTQYLDLTGLTELVAKIKAEDAKVKAYAGTLPAGATQTTILDYVLAQIAASEFSGKAEDVTVDAIEGLTATDAQAAIEEIVGKIATITGTGEGSFAKAISDAIGELKIGDTTYTTVKEYVDALVVAVKKIISNEQGTLTDLTTTDKSNIVAAINEVDAHADAAQSDATSALNKIGTAKQGETAGTGLTGRVEVLEAAIGEGGGVSEQIKTAIEALDAEKSQTAGADGLALSITEVDGKITAISGSIAANTYDAHGAAAAVQGSTTETVASVDAKVSAINNAETGILATAKKYTDDEIAKLDVADTAVANQFVTAVSEENGKITVSRAALTAADIPTLTLAKISDAGTAAAAAVATTAIAEESTDASLVTAAQVAKFVKDEVADITGVTHFRGTFESLEDVTNPKNGDIAIVGVKEYIYVKPNAETAGAWKELGDESLYVTKTTTIAGVDLQNDITKAELLTALNVADGAQVNVLEGVQVNGTDLAITDKKVNVTVATGSANGTVAVNGADVAVKGLDSAAYKAVATTDIAFQSTDSNLATAAQVAKYVDKRIFVGTEAQFEAAKTAGTADEHTFAVITDADESVIESIPTDDIDALFS